MAYKSGFWAGTTVGDAADTAFGAPYSDIEFAEYMAKILSSDNASALVMPGYGANLRCQTTAPDTMTVQVGIGIAFIKGRYFENDALQDLTISTADATNPRLDRIIIRVNHAAAGTPQTIELAVLTGTPAATPSLPTLTQNSTTYEATLYTIWVGAGVTAIAEEEIHDARAFAPNWNFSVSTTVSNLLSNSEHMAFSCLSTVPVGFGSTQPPDMWTKVGTVTSYASASRPSWQTRGRGVTVTAGAASSGYSQSFPCKGSTVYSIITSVNVTAGDVGVLVVTDGVTTYTRYIRRTGAYLTEQVILQTDAASTSITVSLLGLNNTDVVAFGQTMAIEGYSLDFKEVPETIMFKHVVGDASWNATAKSSGTTTIDLDASFQTIILPGTKSIFFFFTGNDSGSAGGTASVSIRPTGAPVGSNDIRLNSETNDAVRAAMGFVGLDSNNQFDIVTVATGVGTLDVTVRLSGIVI